MRPGTQLLMGCCGLIPETGPYTKAEATKLLTKAATFAALLLCDYLHADNTKILAVADPQYVQDYTRYHTSSWDSNLEPLLEEVRCYGGSDQRVSVVEFILWGLIPVLTHICSFTDC